MNREGGNSPTNPMLYDPIPEGSVQTSRVMQFMGATAGKLSSLSQLLWLHIRILLKFLLTNIYMSSEADTFTFTLIFDTLNLFRFVSFIDIATYYLTLIPILIFRYF